MRVEAEIRLVGYARTFDPKTLANLGKTLLNVVDPDLAQRKLADQLAKDERKAARARELTLSNDPYSTGTYLRGKLDPETAEMLRTALEPLAKPRPSTVDGPDKRTYGQRLGDGFHELLRHYLDAGLSPTHAGEKPHLIIKIDRDDLANGTGAGSFLHTNTPISAKTAQLYACDAKISSWGTVNGEPVLTDGVRYFTGKTRRLLELRDRGCAFPGCDRPPAWCHAHHIIAWLKGGPTTIDNGVLLCGHHHRLIHRGEWQVRTAHDNHPEFIPPDWINPQQKPLRNTRLRSRPNPVH